MYSFPHCYTLFQRKQGVTTHNHCLATQIYLTLKNKHVMFSNQCVMILCRMNLHEDEDESKSEDNSQQEGLRHT